MVVVFISVDLSADEVMGKKEIERASKKGQKVAELLCDSSRLPKADSSTTIEKIKEAVIASKACKRLSRLKLEALAWYLKYPSKHRERRKLFEDVPEDAKCPVCGMFVYKYPKWSAKIELNGKEYFFDGVKDMMKFYLFDGDFPFDRTQVSSIVVSDFYTLEAVDAKNAWYVVGSDLYGPMGNELIPFKDKNSSIYFSQDHNGEKIVKFEEITPQMVMALDGIKME
jgi:nitrous oxide reductase accessory protein NosL